MQSSVHLMHMIAYILVLVLEFDPQKKKKKKTKPRHSFYGNISQIIVKTLLSLLLYLVIISRTFSVLQFPKLHLSAAATLYKTNHQKA